jgi:tetratricopeptide (TPR) repeat protein
MSRCCGSWNKVIWMIRARCRGIAVCSVALGVVAGAVVWHFWFARSACESRVRSGDYTGAVNICLDSYRRTHDPGALAWAAKAYMYLRDVEHAEALANQLVHGPRAGDGHAVLSYLELQKSHYESARDHAEAAASAHRATGDERSLANDLVSLALAALPLGDFTAALEAASEALDVARRLRDPRREVAAYLAQADALRQLGDSGSAHDALNHAIARATDPCDVTWARSRNGMCYAQDGQDGLAMLELAEARHANQVCRAQEVTRAVALLEAWLLRTKDPRGAVARLDELGEQAADDVEALVLRGYLAADRGALDEAERHLAHAASLPPPHADWPWEIDCARAELSEQRDRSLGDWLAEFYFRRSVGIVAALRAMARPGSAFLVASHRGPYDGLIALYARTGRWRDALAVVLDLDASDMLRATADEKTPRDGARPEAAVPPSPVDLTASTDVDAVRSAWRSRDLVVVIAQSPQQIGSGGERVYRIRVSQGVVSGEDVGSASEARQWANALFADPDDRRAAQGLGRMIVPRDLLAGSALYVLAIGSLGKVPLAALRDEHGALVVDKLPIVRILSLRASCDDSQGTAPPVVIADPLGNLGGARLEGDIVARALGPQARMYGASTSQPATRAQLWTACDAELLHVAGHVGERGRWRALQLLDGEVGPTEILQRGLAPRIAVLAGCGSAAAKDEEGWGSLAAALLEAGTSVVIATDRSIDDKAALVVVREFYAQPDWRADPARALGRVQVALDAKVATSDAEVVKAQTWAAFTVLGRSPVVHGQSAERCRRGGGQAQ